MTAKSNKRIAVVDTETDPFLYDRVPKPFGLGYYDGESYREYFGDDGECVAQFVDYLESLDDEEKEGLIIYAHNGGKFDFHFFLNYMDEDIVVINGRLSKIYVRGVEFRDSYLLLPLPLSAHQKDTVDYAIFEKDERYKSENFKTIRDYLKSDCIYLHDWITKFAERFGNPLTLPSASFKQLKETGYKTENTNTRYDDKFRIYYYGGRTEVFKGGHHTGDIIYQDINSAYPKAMMDWHPYGNEIITMDYLPDTPCYFATIQARSKGALPFRNEDGFLTFPNDDEIRTYYVSSWEIEAGLKTGTLEILDVVEALQHTKTLPFTDFVNKFYEEKKHYKNIGDKDNETFSKLILNSCYGKFALNSRLFKKYCITPVGHLPPELINWYQYYKVENMNELREAIIFDSEIEDYQAEDRLNILTWEVCNDIDGFTIWQRNEPTGRFYNTATAASITGHVRAFMWETICASEDVYYCDTDSIMCRKFHGKESDELGDWKLECIFDDLFIGGKKLYAGHIKDTPYKSQKQYNRMKEDKQNKYKKLAWKSASKGSRLNPYEIIEIVRDGKVIKWLNDAPAFSLRNGARFVDRNIQMTV